MILAFFLCILDLFHGILWCFGILLAVVGVDIPDVGILDVAVFDSPVEVVLDFPVFLLLPSF